MKAQSSRPSAIVIGAGFGGMAAALRLRAKGYQVTVIDRCEKLGGRGQVFEREGYRHDAGPTVITAPFLFEELFALFDEKMADHLELVPLKIWYRFYYADGSTFDYGGTLEETLAEINKIEPKDVDGYQKLLAHSKRIFDVGFTELSDAPFHRFRTMLAQIPRFHYFGKQMRGLMNQCGKLGQPNCWEIGRTQAQKFPLVKGQWAQTMLMC